jgi:hypothetical protein
MKTHTATQHNQSTVSDFISVLSQAKQDSIVRNEKGIALAAYLDISTLEIVIIEDEN